MPPMYSAIGFFGQMSFKPDQKQKLSSKRKQRNQLSGQASGKVISPPKSNQLSDPPSSKVILPPKYGYGKSAALFSYARTLSQFQQQEGTDLESENFGPGPDDPTDFMGRLLEVGGVVETLQPLYRSLGEDVVVSSDWCGVIVKIDGAGDVLVAFGEGLVEKWIRRKHLGTLKILEEEEELEHDCATPESNNSRKHTSEFLKDWMP